MSGPSLTVPGLGFLAGSSDPTPPAPEPEGSSPAATFPSPAVSSEDTSHPVYNNAVSRTAAAFDEYQAKYISLVDLNTVSGSSDVFRNSLGGYFYNQLDELGKIIVPPMFEKMNPQNNINPAIFSIASFVGSSVNANIDFGEMGARFTTGTEISGITETAGVSGVSDIPGAIGSVASISPAGDPTEEPLASLARKQETILPYVKFVCNIEGDPTYSHLADINKGSKYWQKLMIGGEFLGQTINPMYASSVYDEHYTAINVPYQFIDTKNLANGAIIRSINEISYDYNKYNKTYQNIISGLESEKEAPNWYLLNLFNPADNGVPNLLDTPSSKYYDLNRSGFANLVQSFLTPRTESEDSALDSIPDRVSSDDLNKIIKDFPNRDASLKATIRQNQTNLLFNSSGVRRLLSENSFAVKNRNILPYYGKIDLSTEPSGEYINIFERKGFSTSFMRNLKEVFLEQASEQLPLDDMQFMTNERFLEPSQNGTHDVIATNSETVTYKGVDFTQFLLYCHDNIKCNYDDFTYMDHNTLQVKAASDKLGTYRALNVRDTLRVLNETLSKYSSNGNAYEITDINAIMNIQRKSTPYDEQRHSTMFPKTKYNEVLAYRVEKIGGTATGDSNTQSVIQNFWIFNDSELSELKLTDLQVKYGSEYTYKVYAYYIIKGVKYKFSDLQLTRIVGNVRRDGVVVSATDAMTGLEPASISIDNPITGYCVEYYDPLTGDTVPDLLDGVVGGTDTSVVSSIAYEDTLRLKVSSKNNPAEEPLPPYLANFIVTAQPSVKLVEVPIHEKQVLISDYIPNVLNVDPSYVLNNSNKLVFNLSYQYFSNADELFPDLVDINQTSFRNKYLNSNDLLITDGLNKECVSPARYVDVYRINKKPTSYEDFSGNLIKTIDNKIKDKDFSYRTCIFSDIVKSNTKYYYLFKARSELGVHGHNSQILEAELVNDGGYKYATFELVTKQDMQVDKFKTISDSFRSIIEVVPNLNQITIDDSAVKYGETAKSQYDKLKIGVADQLLWNKTFKIRLTSKKTGKKIDLNLTYSDPSVKLVAD